MRRFIGPVIAAALAAAVGGGIWYSNTQLGEERAAAEARQLEAARQVQLRGLIGSEKEGFFADTRVQQALARHGISVQVEKAGSRSIAQRYEPTRYDFGFPSGAPAGAQLKALAKAPNVYTPFYTPIVFASWRPIAQILEANGIVKQQSGIYYVVDLPRLIELMRSGKRWRELAGNTSFQTNKAVLVNSTDVRSSNSGAMYLALLSYVVNGETVVQSQADVDRTLPVVSELFLRQGFQESSSAGPFEDYLALGMGKTPLLVAYESQMIEFWLKRPDRLQPGHAGGDMVLLYPQPTVYSKHVFVPYTEAGRRLGEVLENDPALQGLAHEYGFRTGGETRGPELWKSRGIAVPDVLVDVVDPPSHEWLEKMIQGIEARFQ